MLNPSPSKIENKILFELEKVSFRPPGWERDLLNRLSVTVRARSNLLIIGSSGCGKSSLVRVVRGLWPHSGTITRRLDMDSCDQALFLAQSPFLSSGTLLDQVGSGAKIREHSTIFLLH